LRYDVAGHCDDEEVGALREILPGARARARGVERDARTRTRGRADARHAPSSL